MELQPWRRLPLSTGKADYNMAVDEYMLEYAAQEKRPVLRFYRWQPAALSIGYFQKHGEEVNEAACQKAGIDWIRRPTGGRAVLHQHELTYAVALPLGYPGLPLGITESYRWLSQALVVGLQGLGVPAELAAPTTGLERGQTAACFDSPARYEITVNQQKIVGSAQVRREGVLLQHGSILQQFDLDLLLTVMMWRSDKAKQAAGRLLRAKAGSIDSVLDPMPTDNEFEEAFVRGFADSYGVKTFLEPMTPAEQRRVAYWQQERYLQNSWNRRI